MAERFVSPCPPLEPEYREILETLIEECAEVTQRATKMLRFGRDEVQPGQDQSNRERLSNEVGDLLAMLDIAMDAELIDGNIASEQSTAKYKKFDKFRQHGGAHG